MPGLTIRNPPAKTMLHNPDDAIEERLALGDAILEVPELLEAALCVDRDTAYETIRSEVMRTSTSSTSIPKEIIAENAITLSVEALRRSLKFDNGQRELDLEFLALLATYDLEDREGAPSRLFLSAAQSLDLITPKQLNRAFDHLIKNSLIDESDKVGILSKLEFDSLNLRIAASVFKKQLDRDVVEESQVMLHRITQAKTGSSLHSEVDVLAQAPYPIQQNVLIELTRQACSENGVSLHAISALTQYFSIVRHQIGAHIQSEALAWVEYDNSEVGREMLADYVVNIKGGVFIEYLNALITLSEHCDQDISRRAKELLRECQRAKPDIAAPIEEMITRGRAFSIIPSELNNSSDPEGLTTRAVGLISDSGFEVDRRATRSLMLPTHSANVVKRLAQESDWMGVLICGYAGPRIGEFLVLQETLSAFKMLHERGDLKLPSEISEAELRTLSPFLLAGWIRSLGLRQNSYWHLAKQEIEGYSLDPNICSPAIFSALLHLPTPECRNRALILSFGNAEESEAKCLAEQILKNGESGYKFLITLLGSRNGDIAKRALNQNKQEVSALMLGVLEHAVRSKRANILEVLNLMYEVGVRSSDGAKFILDIVESNSIRPVGFAAVRALGSVAESTDKTAIELLKSKARSDGDLSTAALLALGNIGGILAADALFDLYKSANPSHAQVILNQLARMGDVGAWKLCRLSLEIGVVTDRHPLRRALEASGGIAAPPTDREVIRKAVPHFNLRELIELLSKNPDPNTCKRAHNWLEILK